MTGPKQRVRKDAASRREQALDEAARLVGENGYYGFGIQELADRCGLTKAGLLHHFGSKEALLITLLHNRDAEHERHVADLLGDRLRDTADVHEQREIFVDALACIVARNAAQPELMRLQVILRGETINVSHPAHDYFAAREAAKLELIRDSIAPFTRAPQALARQLLAMLGGLEEQWLREDGGFELAEQARMGIASLLREHDPVMSRSTPTS